MGKAAHGPEALCGDLSIASGDRAPATRDAAETALRVTYERLARQKEALFDLAQHGVAGTDLDAAAATIMEAATRTLDAARASVWVYDDQRTLIRCMDLYEQTTAVHSRGIELRREAFPGYFAAMERERSIVAHDARTDPRTFEFTAVYLTPLGITSMLDTPIRVGGRAIGVLCIEHVGPMRQWTADEEAFAASLTNLLAVAFEAADRRRSEERYRLVNRATNDVIWDWDLSGGQMHFGESLARTLGFAPDKVSQTIEFWAEHIHPEDRQRVVAGLAEVIDGNGDSWSDEYRFRRSDGTYADIFDRGYVTRRPDGTAIRMIGAMQDVTQRRLAEHRLREEMQVTDVLYRLGRTVAAELDLQKIVQTVTDETVRVTGAQFGAFFYNLTNEQGASYTLYALAGVSREAFAGFPMPRMTPIFRPTFEGRGIVRYDDVTASPLYGAMTPHRGMPPGHLPVRSYLAAPVVSRSGEVLGGLFLGHEQIGVFHDRDERIVEGIAAQAAIAIDNARLFDAARRAGELMAHQALHDDLTGLPNRALFHDRVSRCLHRAKRDAAYQFAVLFLDLDRFKVVNDSLGHAAGDRLLKAVGERLATCLRDTDSVSRADLPAGVQRVVARLGGDEFTVLLDELREPCDAARVAERVLTEVCRPVEFDGQEITVTASVGVVGDAARYESAADILRDADAAMYQAKELGRNRYAIFDDALHARAVARLRLENDLRRAVDRGELLLHYQPIVSLQSRQLAGFEALVRWRRDGRLVAPGDFIPIAEDTGLIVPIGAWVLREACRQLAAWHARFPDFASLTMSINLSRRQLDDAGLRPLLGDVLRETGLDPRLVKLEITESIIMDGRDNAREVLAAIKATGVRISMDDFGTGYSSLSCLHRFPLDELKVDRSFIGNLEGRRDGAAVVNAVVGLAHNLGLQVVAEGMEKPEQAAFLQAVDCDMGQGYLFSHPLPAGEAETFIRAQPRNGERGAA